MTEPRRIDLSVTEVIDQAALTRARVVADPTELSDSDRMAVTQFLTAFQPHSLVSHFSDGGLLAGWHAISETLLGRFCDFPDPVFLPGSSFPLSYALGGGRRPLNMTYTVAPSNEAAAIAGAAQQSLGIWSFAAPALAPQFRMSGPADLTLQTGPLGQGILGSTTHDGSRITLQPGLSTTAKFRHVLLHEIGHALGLLHSTNPHAVMYPIAGSLASTTLIDDDVSAIRAEYGWSPQRNIPGRGTDRGPALCPFLGRLVMTWKGIGDDHNIWFATSNDGVAWSDQRIVYGAATSDQPALATGTDGRLIMAFKGVPGDAGLYWTIFDGNNWGPVMRIDGRGSSNAPALGWQASATPDHDVLYMAWKGMDNDAGLYFAHLDGSIWSDQHHIGGVGSADGPALTTDVDGALRMVWRGMPGDPMLYTSVLHDMFWEPQQLVEWIVPGNGQEGTSRVDHAASEYGPSAKARFTQTFFVGETPPTPNKVFLAWRGSGGDQGLYFTQRALDQQDSVQVPGWSSQVNIPGMASSHRPTVALFNGLLHLAWKGMDDDHSIYMTRLAT